MHIGSMINHSKTSGFTMNLKLGQANKKKTQASDEEEKSEKKAGSFKALEQKKKEEEFDIVTMLQKQKESLQKRVGRYSSQLESIAKQKEAVPFEMRTVEENGEIKQIKVYTEENEKILAELTGQEDTVTANIKSANEEMLALDEQIRKAAIEQERLKAEKANKEKEEEIKEKASKKDENLTEEEKKEKAEKAQVEFFAQSDSIKQYIRESKVTKAKMQQEKTFKEISMAKDAYRQEASAASAAHHAEQTRLDMLADKIEEKTGVRPEFYNAVRKLPDTVVLEELGRVREGALSPDEGKSVEASEIADLKAGIDGIEKSINENMGKINKKARELEEEKEEDRVSKDKKDEEEEENKGETLEDHVEEK